MGLPIVFIVIGIILLINPNFLRSKAAPVHSKRFEKIHKIIVRVSAIIVIALGIAWLAADKIFF